MIGETGLKRISQKIASRSKKIDVFGAPKKPENRGGDKRTKTGW
jgi:hypothetical protein